MVGDNGPKEILLVLSTQAFRNPRMFLDDLQDSQSTSIGFSSVDVVNRNIEKFWG